MIQYETILNQVIGEYKILYGKSANATVPFEGQKKIQKNIRLFDWFQMTKIAEIMGF